MEAVFIHPHLLHRESHYDICDTGIPTLNYLLNRLLKRAISRENERRGYFISFSELR